MRNQKEFPDFMIIGPHRCGTTWLFWNLFHHPQIFLPIEKETHYFCDHIIEKPKISYTSIGKRKDLSEYRKLMKDNTRTWLYKMKSAMFAFGEYYNPIVSGEATACYAMLDKSVIEVMTGFNLDLKVILMVRNPIERAWSHAKLHFGRNFERDFKYVSEIELKSFFLEDYISMSGKYTQIIEKWLEFLPREQLYIGNFSRIKREPKTLLTDICDFLGVRSSPKYTKKVRTGKINQIAGIEELEITRELHQFLEGLYEGESDELWSKYQSRWD